MVTLYKYTYAMYINDAFQSQPPVKLADEVCWIIEHSVYSLYTRWYNAIQQCHTTYLIIQFNFYLCSFNFRRSYNSTRQFSSRLFTSPLFLIQSLAYSANLRRRSHKIFDYSGWYWLKKKAFCLSFNQSRDWLIADTVIYNFEIAGYSSWHE